MRPGAGAAGAAGAAAACLLRVGPCAGRKGRARLPPPGAEPGSEGRSALLCSLDLPAQRCLGLEVSWLLVKLLGSFRCGKCERGFGTPEPAPQSTCEEGVPSPGRPACRSRDADPWGFVGPTWHRARLPKLDRSRQHPGREVRGSPPFYKGRTEVVGSEAEPRKCPPYPAAAVAVCRGDCFPPWTGEQ